MWKEEKVIDNDEDYDEEFYANIGRRGHEEEDSDDPYGAVQARRRRF